MSQPDEKKYTYEQAIVVGKRALCAKLGHKFERFYTENAAGQTCMDKYTCNFCDVVITFTFPELS